jgi:hypothetical protein
MAVRFVPDRARACHPGPARGYTAPPGLSGLDVERLAPWRARRSLRAWTSARRARREDHAALRGTSQIQRLVIARETLLPRAVDEPATVTA